MNDTAIEILFKTIKKIEGAYSHATIRAYRADFLKFIEFCNSKKYKALPATSIAVAEFIVYLTESGICSSSIRRAIAGLSAIHRLNRFTDPTKDPDVNIEMKRMHRKLGRFSKQAYGITKIELGQMIKAQDKSLRGLRNKALLLTAYDTLCRRKELTELLIEDVKFLPDGSGLILLRKSKVDQEASGFNLKIGKNTLNAILSWTKISKLDNGPIFRGISKKEKINNRLSASQINRIFKKIAEKAKLNKEIIGKISGHSLRVGAARDLANKGVDFPILMSKGRWTKIDTVMRYVQN